MDTPTASGRPFSWTAGSGIFDAMTRMRWIAGLLVASVVLWGVWGSFFLGVLHEPPFGMHSWKQGDCFALAQRFLEDGNWDILDPRGQSIVPVEQRVNAELPLTPWLAAASARVLGPERLPEAFRVFTLFFSALGPLALFVFVRHRTGSLVAGMLPMVFTAASPIFAYYASGFHPDAAAFGLMMMGMVLLLMAGDGKRSRLWTIAGVALMTLGGLTKMSLAPYMAVPAIVVYHRWRVGNPGAPSWAVLRHLPPGVGSAFGISGFLLVGQFFYLQARSVAYAPTFFTASPHPFTSLDHLSTVVTRAWDTWLADLFTPPQLVLLAIVLGVQLVWAFTERKVDDLAVASAVTAGVMVFLFLFFGKQFEWHDYYSIAAFYPLAALLVARLTLEVWEVGRRSDVETARAVTALLLAGLAVMVVLPLQGRLAHRVTPWWRAQTSWLHQARKTLEECGDHCDGPVAVLGAQAPNTALTCLDRQGIVLGSRIGTGLGVPPMSSMADVAAFLDSRGVKVLVIKRSVFDSLGPDVVRRWFRKVSGEGDGLVFVRKAGATTVDPEGSTSVSITAGDDAPRPRGSHGP